MATKRMLVDATHPEETRIVVTEGNRLEEFDFESASRKQLRGNIYLAKITRVEPSLQAAFVEYGGNRQGFLAFSEIHPDYYQIPAADKEALLAIQEADPDEEEAISEDSDNSDEEMLLSNDIQDDPIDEDQDNDAQDDDEILGENIEQSEPDDLTVEQIGGIDPLEDDDAEDESQAKIKTIPIKKYKIQEVIKRRQILLVQVVKEERGNKGAALTTYLSLAGRYSVLMPNTARGGGISRKITNAGDRKRLKEVARELEVPSGMGVILRTAGASRTKVEINRDFDYLMRLWENVRTLTLKTTAPCLVYEEGSLIKRTIRDLYNKDITELLVAGAKAHKEAKEFMRMIMPSHAKKVKQYTDNQPIFSRFNVETQLDSMFSPQVTLPSGGYIVINPTEALVSIDVNSGRATKERNIEATALQTNLEAAEEVARQLRLRDMAGLVVIDFIDMMEKRSIRNVERKLKDSLRHDRARIQVGRISHFGLLEMSRQRMRFGVLESSTNVCPTCAGAGIVRSVESMALMVMRAIEDHIQRKSDHSINVLTPTKTALFLLNAKRNSLAELEAKYDISISVSNDDTLAGSGFQIEKGEKRQNQSPQKHISVNSAQMAQPNNDDDELVEDEGEATPKRRRQRRNGRGGQNRNKNVSAQDISTDSDKPDTQDSDKLVGNNNENKKIEVIEGEEEQPKRRRRGRRGGRRNRRTNDEDANKQAEAKEDQASSLAKPETTARNETTADAEAVEAQDSTQKPKPKARRPRKKQTKAEQLEVEQPQLEPAKVEPTKTETTKAEPAKAKKTKVEIKTETDLAKTEKSTNTTKKSEKPKAKPARKKTKVTDDEIVVTSTKSKEATTKATKKGGWWQRGGGFFG